MKQFNFYQKLPKSLTTVTPFSKLLAMILFILFPLIGFYLGFSLKLSSNEILQDDNRQTVCTIEAKLCPDGSYVGRVGSKCEFTKCPQKTTPTPTCKPRPACLDAKPRCMIPETSDMCPKSTPTVKPITENLKPGNGCKIGGCSGEICQDASSEPVASTCIYKAEYACYKTARCEKQQTGKCGWTKTPELTTCLSNSK